MPLQQATKDLLGYLRKHPRVRSSIRAGRDRTLLYAGSFFAPIWQEINRQKLRDARLADLQTLPDLLERVQVPDSPHAHLLAWAQALDAQQPWADNGFIVWRALSGIFAANAVGAVSFAVGSSVTARTKVFAATEMSVLARNPNVDANTHELVAYFQRCIRSGQSQINLGFTAA